MKQELLTLPEHVREFTPVFSGARVARYFVFYVMFCRSFFVILSFFFWSLCCLSFFDLWLLLTPLVSSNFSYNSYSVICEERGKKNRSCLNVYHTTKTIYQQKIELYITFIYYSICRHTLSCENITTIL